MDVGTMDRTIIEDTRNKPHHHEAKNKWWSEHGVPVVRKKLDFGDYQRADGFSNISIDSKQDMDEVAQNIGRDHDRFIRECERAKSAGYRLIILVEQHKEYNDRGRIDTWIPGTCRRCAHYRRKDCDPREVQGRVCMGGRKPLQGSTARKIIDAIERRHGARFMFCKKSETAKVICDTLGIEYE